MNRFVNRAPDLRPASRRTRRPSLKGEMMERGVVRSESADQRFARLLDRTSQPLLITDLTGRITHANLAFGEMLGYKSRELLGRSVAELTPLEWYAATTAAIERLEATSIAQRYEKEYLHRDGHRVAVELFTDFERDADDRPRGYYAFATDVTCRKLAETALRESERTYRELFDEAPIGYHVIDTQGIIQSVNRAECDLLGYSHKEMIGRAIFDFVVPEQRAAAEEAVGSAYDGDASALAVDRDYLTKDGRRIALHIENRLLHDAEGRMVGMRSMMQDITRRKLAEEALLASERRLRALFEGIEDSVFVHDLQGRILDANPAASRRLGYTREEFLELTTADVDDPEFSAGYDDRLRFAARTGAFGVRRPPPNEGWPFDSRGNQYVGHSARRSTCHSGRDPRYHGAASP